MKKFSKNLQEILEWVLLMKKKDDEAGIYRSMNELKMADKKKVIGHQKGLLLPFFCVVTVAFILLGASQGCADKEVMQTPSSSASSFSV